MRKTMITMALLLALTNQCNAPIHNYDGLEFHAPVTNFDLSDEPQETEVVTKYTANVSWYTASADECGKSDGITASGERAVAGVTVAADDLPLGTRVRINGQEYIVQDRFGGGHTNRIDIYCDTKAEAFANGRQMLEVEVLT